MICKFVLSEYLKKRSLEMHRLGKGEGEIASIDYRLELRLPITASIVMRKLRYMKPLFEELLF